MVKNENYAKAYTEVIKILENVDETSLKNIPNDFIKMLEDNRDKRYKFEFNKNGIEENILMLETRIVLAYIYINYWSTKEEKERIEQKFKYDIIESEKKKKEKYNINIFEKNEINYKKQIESNNKLIKNKKNNFIKKIITQIKALIERTLK